MRIALSDDTYQVINPPNSLETSEYYQPHLGKSKNGVHFVVLDDHHRLQVWFLDESEGKMEWVLKHGAQLQAVELNPKNTDRPWILQYGYHDDDQENGLGRKLDWDSDDDNADDIEEWGQKGSSGQYIEAEVLGFHPYREIIFLLMWSSRVMAYYFNSSKVQDLGELTIKHNYQNICGAFIYTPCWTGELSKNN
ncbi:hypothetical protein HU200_014723 [Digitaria exilis]|uniref:Uncharacterized protein n=1 Tax=Digitaria exilis TaxID=1010633 RepID=A0A835FAU7_9POAL|nr:hypothetical protein HU200_014723 [Digitaria exilis]